MNDFSGKITGEALFHALRQISEHRTSGVLTLQRGRTHVEIYFREGDLLKVESSARAKRRRFGSLMHRAGFISKEQITYALAVQKETLQRIGLIFSDRLGFEPELIEDFARLQTTDAFFEVILWDKGQFEFVTKEVGLAWDRTEPVSVDYLLTEARRISVDGPQILAECPKNKEGFAQAKPLPAVDDGILTDDDRRLFESFDIPRSFDTAIYRSRLGKFRGGRAIRTLVAHGYLQKSKPQKVSLDQAWWKRVWAQLKPLQVVGATVIYSLIILSFVGLFLLSDLSWYGISWQGVTRYRARTVDTYFWSSSSKVLRRSLRLYKLRHGNYPDSLSALSKDWILSEDFLKTYVRGRLLYWSDGKQYSLSPRQVLSKGTSHLPENTSEK